LFRYILKIVRDFKIPGLPSRQESAMGLAIS